MGFAYRKTGDYAKALEMYDKALALQPGFPDAIEYRGEAYLGLNRIDDAKQAYLELFASDRKQADILMKAMTDWVAERHTDPAGVDPGGVVRRSRAGSRSAARSPARRPAWRSPRSTRPGGSAERAVRLSNAACRWCKAPRCTIAAALLALGVLSLDAARRTRTPASRGTCRAACRRPRSPLTTRSPSQGRPRPPALLRHAPLRQRHATPARAVTSRRGRSPTAARTRWDRRAACTRAAR